MKNQLPFLYALASDWGIRFKPGRGAVVSETWIMPDRETLEAFLSWIRPGANVVCDAPDARKVKTFKRSLKVQFTY